MTSIIIRYVWYGGFQPHLSPFPTLCCLGKISPFLIAFWCLRKYNRENGRKLVKIFLFFHTLTLTIFCFWGWNPHYARYAKYATCKHGMQLKRNVQIFPGSTTTLWEWGHSYQHSGGGWKVHFFLPLIWACQELYSTQSIWGEIRVRTTTDSH